MTKHQIKVDITTYQGFTATADDATVDGQGSGAFGAIQTGKDVTIAGNGTITYIPFKAIDHAEITQTNVTVADPTDDVCP